MNPKRIRRAAIYSRVSTDKQTTDNQERELREIAERSGWEVVETYRGHWHIRKQGPRRTASV
jgi:DNA invertase Pin-like site-specific DNA recombinase